MGGRFEFMFYRSSQTSGAAEPELALLGSLGWEIRGLTSAASGEYIVALQREIDREHPLPEREVLAATLEAPLVAPGPEELDAV